MSKNLFQIVNLLEIMSKALLDNKIRINLQNKMFKMNNKTFFTIIAIRK
jgi:hypothetical protein